MVGTSYRPLLPSGNVTDAGHVYHFNLLVPAFRKVKRKQRKLIVTVYLIESNISKIVMCQHIIHILKTSLRCFPSFFVFMFVASLQNRVCVL